MGVGFLVCWGGGNEPAVFQQTLWRTPMRKLKNLVATSKGAALVEYGILVGLIAVIAITAVVALGTTVTQVFDRVNSTLTRELKL